MRRLALALAVPAVIAAVAPTARAESPDTHAVVDRLPELATVVRGRTRIVVRGELSVAQAREAVAVVDQVIADVQAKFAAAATTRDPDVTLVLFASDRRYREVATAAFGDVPSDWGFYRPDKRVAIANFGVSIGNLRHELVHALIGDDFPGIPSWMNEGIGALYGTASHARAGFTFLVNYRLRDLQRALREKTLPSLDDLTASDRSSVYGDRAMVWYALGRYVLLYMDRRGKLTAFYRALRDGPHDAAAQRTLLAKYVDEAAFRAWAAQLRL